jgi:hypothetical protein
MHPQTPLPWPRDVLPAQLPTPPWPCASPCLAHLSPHPHRVHGGHNRESTGRRLGVRARHTCPVRAPYLARVPELPHALTLACLAPPPDQAEPRAAGQCAASTADFPAACRPHEQSKAWALVIDSLDVEAAGASWRCLGVRLVESHPRCPCC